MVNAGTIAGPSPYRSTEKEGSPIDTDASFRTNSQASANLPPLWLVGAFQPATLLEAEIAQEALAPPPAESAALNQVVLKKGPSEDAQAGGLFHKTTTAQ